MKRLAIVVIVLAVLGGIVLYKPSTTHYQAPEAEVVKETVEVDALEQSIQAAQEAKKGEIEAIAQQEYQERYDYEMKKVRLEVIKESNAKLDAMQSELEAETKKY